MSIEIVIVDDDPMVGELTSDLLSEAGYTSALIQDSSLVLAAVREHQPRLVLLDILMPGLDGLSLLHAIKRDPSFSGIKVAVVSAKNFQAEIDRAKSYGADLFVRKPYDVQTFPKLVTELIGPPAGSGSQPVRKSRASVRVWGSPALASTPCLSVEAAGRLFVLDAGEGAIALGAEMLRSGRHNEAWVLLSHYHPDHVAGLGLLPFLRQEGFSLHVLGPAQPEKGLDAHLREAVERSFAKDRRPVTAKISLHELREDSYELAPGLRISAFYLNHPGTTLGYLLHLQGKRLAYCPDSELYGDEETALHDYDERTARTCRGVDLLVHDARWLRKDRAAHLNEGHSDAATAGSFAADCEAGRLWLFHADPGYSAEQREALVAEARQALEEKGAEIPCEVAEDGVSIEL